jgi:PAS domain S-box-containing protein
MRKILLVLPLLLLFAAIRPVAANDAGPTFVPGAHLRFEHITIDDGLSQNAGLALLQDRQGYLWIGTGDGLNRYDGYNLVQYKNDPDNPSSLSHNGILALHQDREGFLWIGTWGGGLNRLDPTSGKATRYPSDPARPTSLSHPIVADVFRDEQGTVWVGTLGGLDRLDPQSGAATHYRHDARDPTSLSSDAVSVIAPDGKGKVWIGTGAFNTVGAGLNLFDPATGTARRFERSGECLASPNIADILPLSDGSLWIAFGGYGVSGGGIDYFNPASGACRHYDNTTTFGKQLTDNNVTDLTLDRDGALWAASWSGGVWRLSPDGKFINIRHNPTDPDSLSNDSTFSVLPDRSGVIWIGTLNAGINKLNLNTLQFRTYRRDAANPHSLPSNHVGSFAQTSDGTLWAGTWESGLVRFDPANGTFTPFRTDPANPNSLSGDMVSSLYADPDGTLWVGTLGNGLNHFDPRSGTFTHYLNDPADPTGLLENQVSNITRDSAGRLWVGSFAGLSRLDPGQSTFVNYPLPAPPTPFQMIGDELWMGTWGAGVYRLNLSDPANLDPATAAFSILKNEPDNPNSLSQNGVWAIVQSTDGLIWLGTEGGLNRYDPRTGRFKIYTAKNGLRNATIMGILPDQAGFLWLTTNNGLVKFDPQSETFKTYDKSDGLQGNEFNSNGYFQAKNGDFYVGGVGGFSVFDPLNLSPIVLPPPVVLTRFSIFNTPQPVDLSGATPIRLNYDQNFISFEFAALDFQSPARNQYAYQLEGFDKDWIQAGTRNYASYTNLPGGDYTFRVRAANSGGVWNETGATLKLTVIPPLWQTWPFQLGVLIGVFALVIVGFRWRMSSVRQQNIRLQGMVDEQKRVESELRQSEARFKAIFENSAVGMGLMSTNRIVLDSNPAMCAMLGYTREELVGQSPEMVTYPDDFSGSTEQFKQLLAGEISHYVSERRYVRKNGEVFWTRISMSLVRDPQGSPLYLVGLINDIDAQKRAAERLAAQEAEYRQRLEQRIAERTNELNLANERLREKAAQDAVTAERTRLARDLHDAVTQTLFSTTLIADVLPEIWAMNPDEGRRRLEEIRQMTRGALAEMRTLLVELRPNALVEVPLPTLLRQLTEALVGRARVNIQLSAEGERKLPGDVQVGLYRLAQEALNNIVKHAKASQAVVTLRMGETVRLTVADNGIGFDPVTVTADHLGLKIMRERAEAIGAKLSIYSEPGEGTQISVTWGNTR